MFVALTVSFSLITAFAHGGRTDDNGGHYNRDTGEYHYHHGHPAHDHPNGECPYIEANKDNQTNANKKIGFWGALLISVCAGWFGGAFLSTILFFPLELFFKAFFEEHLELIQLSCSILVSVVTFVFVYILN
jgi:hypothetical protein